MLSSNRSVATAIGQNETALSCAQQQVCDYMRARVSPTLCKRLPVDDARATESRIARALRARSCLCTARSCKA